MPENDLETIENCQDTLMECLLMIMKASNRSTDKNEIEKLRAMRKKMHLELDRMESANINDALLPDQLKNAVDELNRLRGSIEKEIKKIQKSTATLSKVDRYLNIASQTLQSVGVLLVHV